MNKKQFKRERKAYEQRLEKRAKQGVLTFNEKEEYQSMLIRKQRKKALYGERVQKVIFILVTIILIMIIRIYLQSEEGQNLLNLSGYSSYYTETQVP